MTAVWWRVGHSSAPTKPAPRDVSRWSGRFDDPNREFQTVYAARTAQTALCETLAPLRPSAVTFAELRASLRSPLEVMDALSGVRLSDFDDLALVSAVAVLAADTRGAVFDLSNARARSQLKRRHPDLLANAGVAHLDEADVLAVARGLTQALARQLYDAGHCGITYRSNIDGGRCLALFCDRGYLRPRGEAEPLSNHVSLVADVCDMLDLRLIRSTRDQVFVVRAQAAAD